MSSQDNPSNTSESKYCQPLTSSLTQQFNLFDADSDVGFQRLEDSNDESNDAIYNINTLENSKVRRYMTSFSTTILGVVGFSPLTTHPLTEEIGDVQSFQESQSRSGDPIVSNQDMVQEKMDELYQQAESEGDRDENCRQTSTRSVLDPHRAPFVKGSRVGLYLPPQLVENKMDSKHPPINSIALQNTTEINLAVSLPTHSYHCSPKTLVGDHSLTVSTNSEFLPSCSHVPSGSTVVPTSCSISTYPKPNLPMSFDSSPRIIGFGYSPDTTSTDTFSNHYNYEKSPENDVGITQSLTAAADWVIRLTSQTPFPKTRAECALLSQDDDTFPIAQNDVPLAAHYDNHPFKTFDSNTQAESSSVTSAASCLQNDTTLSQSRLSQALELGAASVSAVVNFPLRMLNDPIVSGLLYIASEESSADDGEESDGDAELEATSCRSNVPQQVISSDESLPLQRRWTSPKLTQVTSSKEGSSNSASENCFRDSHPNTSLDITNQDIPPGISSPRVPRVPRVSRFSRMSRWAWDRGTTVSKTMMETIDKVVDIVLPELLFSDHDHQEDSEDDVDRRNEMSS